jgi:hypothetical protein
VLSIRREPRFVVEARPPYLEPPAAVGGERHANPVQGVEVQGRVVSDFCVVLAVWRPLSLCVGRLCLAGEAHRPVFGMYVKHGVVCMVFGMAVRG